MNQLIYRETYLLSANWLHLSCHTGNNLPQNLQAARIAEQQFSTHANAAGYQVFYQLLLSTLSCGKTEIACLKRPE